MIKPLAKRDEETMVLNDAVRLLMNIKGCSAQVALEELLTAWGKGELPIMAQMIRRQPDEDLQ